MRRLSVVQIEVWRAALLKAGEQGAVLPPGCNVLCDLALAGIGLSEAQIRDINAQRLDAQAFFDVNKTRWPA